MNSPFISYQEIPLICLFYKSQLRSFSLDTIMHQCHQRCDLKILMAGVVNCIRLLRGYNKPAAKAFAKKISCLGNGYAEK